MSRNVLVLFLLVAVICATSMSNPPPLDCPIKPPPPTKPPPPPKCPKNEVWKKCGPAIQPSCKNPNPICKEECIPCCVCKNGQLRNAWGKCVDPCDC